MNKANKITMSRIIMSLIIITIMLFPFDQVGLEFPTYILKGNIVIDLKYILVGILFVIASFTDFLDGHVARKYNMVTDFGKMIDAISDKLLTNSVLIILACNGKVSTIIAVVIVMRDIIVVLTLFYNLPFELIPLRVSDFLLAVAAILSVISGIKYYIMAKPYLKDR